MRTPNSTAHAATGSHIRAILESYRSDAAFAAVLTDSFMRRMEAFGAALALWGARINLTARPQDPEETALHIIDSLMPLVLANRPQPVLAQEQPANKPLRALPEAFAGGNRILDFGSGAGFPGLVLASACPARFTLAESRRKRASFLRIVSAEMQLDNVEVLATRLAPETAMPSFDAVVSRASGPAPDFYPIAARALLPGGHAILYASPAQRLDLAPAKKAGLISYRRYHYSLRRGGPAAERILAVWDKPEKVP